MRTPIPFGLLCSLFVASGCRQPLIEGVVTDHLGKPAAAVRVELLGSTFSALTLEDGSFSLPYVPGELNMLVSKDGYLPVQRDYDIAISTTYPSAPVVLYPHAEGAALSALCAEGPVAIPSYELEKGENSGTRGLRHRPAVTVPADCWGFVWTPSEEELSSSDEPAEQLAAALRGQQHRPRFELRTAHWQEHEAVKRWRGYETVSLRRWVSGSDLELQQRPTDAQGTRAVELRPAASFEDGVYLILRRGDERRAWAFRVGDEQEVGHAD
jgi:hypothetical protein